MTDNLSPFYAWVKGYFEAQGQSDLVLSAIEGDAGFRRYFRLSSKGISLPYLAVFAPPEHEDNPAFIRVCDLLRAGGVPAPRIFVQDVEQGFLLVEKLGDQVVLDRLTPETVDGIYHQAMNTLFLLQRCQKGTGDLPLYDREMLLREMQLLTQWFIPKLLHHRISSEEQGIISRCFDLLLDNAQQQPSCLVHRDYHSRNLVIREGYGLEGYGLEGYGLEGHGLEGHSPLGVIDFQDAVMGPLTYDLVSLLRDCYVQWPEADVDKWALSYKRRLQSEGLLDKGLSDIEFKRQFDWMGLQRHLKVLGIFARLSLRDGKHRYLKDLPLVVHYVQSVASQYRELDEFCAWFDTVIVPLVQKQSWFRTIGQCYNSVNADDRSGIEVKP